MTSRRDVETTPTTEGTTSTMSPMTPMTTMTTMTNRSTTMNLMFEQMARAQMAERLGEAHELRRGHQLATARRLTRRAERASQQARLALARSL